MYTNPLFNKDPAGTNAKKLGGTTRNNPLAKFKAAAMPGKNVTRPPSLLKKAVNTKKARNNVAKMEVGANRVAAARKAYTPPTVTKKPVFTKAELDKQAKARIKKILGTKSIKNQDRFVRMINAGDRAGAMKALDAKARQLKLTVTEPKWNPEWNKRL